MKKMIWIFLAVLSLGASCLAGCGSGGNTGDVSADELMVMLVDNAKVITRTPGWLRVVEEIVYDIDQENSGTLSNGAVLPLEQVNETWYHINDSGQVYQYVNIMRTPGGEVIQVSVFKDNVIFNITTNLVVSMNPYSLGALDYRFTEEMQDFTDRTGGTPAVEVRDMDGRQVAIFTIEEELEEPATTDNYLEPVHSIRTVAYFDMETGLLFRLERFRTFEDGSERTYYLTEIVVEPDAQPSQDILDYILGID